MNGRTMILKGNKTICEIDALYEHHSPVGVIPIITEITLCTLQKCHAQKKKYLIGELYGRKPFLLKVTMAKPSQEGRLLCDSYYRKLEIPCIFALKETAASYLMNFYCPLSDL